MKQKSSKQQPTVSTDSVAEKRNKTDAELTEKELGNVAGGLSLNYTKVEVEYKNRD